MRNFLALLMVGAAVSAVPVLAQNKPTTLDARVGKIEKEVGALQRKVFPGGAGSFLEPEISRVPGATPAPGTPASTPIADLTARMDAVETQLTALTGQIEQAGFRQRQFEEQFARYRMEMDAKIAALAPPPSATAEVEAPAPAAARPVVPTKAPPTPAATSSATNEARKLAVAAIDRPTGGDPASDDYNYGYRLWAAKFYPEAQAQLKATVEKYPSSGIASRAQNLLGRAYMDDNRPNLAALAFRDSYEKWPKGDRAADSLAYFGEVLIQLKKPKDACKAYEVLDEVFSPLNATLKGMMDKGRARAQCGG